MYVPIIYLKNARRIILWFCVLWPWPCCQCHLPHHRDCHGRGRSSELFPSFQNIEFARNRCQQFTMWNWIKLQVSLFFGNSKTTNCRRTFGQPIETETLAILFQSLGFEHLMYSQKRMSLFLKVADRRWPWVTHKVPKVWDFWTRTTYVPFRSLWMWPPPTVPLI